VTRDSVSEDKVEEIINDLATQIETNTKTMMILFDERKEMILKLMAMVEELQPIVVKQREAIQILTAEIMRLRAQAPGKTIQSKKRSSRYLSGQLNTRTSSTHI
jgi:UDP-N-acetylmuramyl tripeptide synthase